jgi:2'-5' RNA ligase
VILRGLGAFPDEAAATTLWTGVEDPYGGLRAVAAELDEVVHGLGLATEKRAFRPHVTVGRCKRGVDAVDESRRSAQGATYVLRGQAPLRAARGE